MSLSLPHRSDTRGGAEWTDSAGYVVAASVLQPTLQAELTVLQPTLEAELTLLLRCYSQHLKQSSCLHTTHFCILQPTLEAKLISEHQEVALAYTIAY